MALTSNIAADRLDRSRTWRWKRELVRRRKVRRKMARKISPNEDGAIYTLGYNVAVARKATGLVAEFQGSSLNRKKYDKERIRLEKPIDRGDFESKRAEIAYGLQCVRENETRARQVARDKLGAAPGVGGRIHVLAKRSRGKVRDKFAALFAASGRSATFATFSFIQAVTDHAAVKILNKFLTALRKRFKGLQYIWVAERQNENQKFPGNIHFHMMLNKYLPVADFNALWTLQQYNAGLKGYSQKLRRILEIEDIHRLTKNPADLQKFLNPFDIKKCSSTDRLAGYLTMYVTKNKDSFSCAAWHCSRGVSRTFTRRVISLELFREVSGENNYTIDDDTGEYFRGKVFALTNAPFVVMGYILNKKYFRPHMNVIEAINRWILSEDFKPDIPILSDAQYLSRYTPDDKTFDFDKMMGCN